MASSPASLFSFSGKFLVAIAPPLFFGESFQVLRPLRAIGGSDQLAGGNDALAFALTAKSSYLGIMMVPFSASKYIGAGVGASVPTPQLFKSLITVLLVPLILGKEKKKKKRIQAFLFAGCSGFPQKAMLYSFADEVKGLSAWANENLMFT